MGCSISSPASYRVLGAVPLGEGVAGKGTTGFSELVNTYSLSLECIKKTIIFLNLLDEILYSSISFNWGINKKSLRTGTSQGLYTTDSYELVFQRNGDCSIKTMIKF